MAYIGFLRSGYEGKPARYEFGAESFEDYLYRLNLFIEHLFRGGTRDSFDIQKAIEEDRRKKEG